MAISEILTYSRIEAQSSPESRPVRQWTVRVYELVEGNSKPPEVGHAIVVTAPGLGHLHVNPKYRGRGLATTVAEEAIEWFEGLVNVIALAIAAQCSQQRVPGS